MRIRASPAKMPEATRAAKRGLGSTAGIGWTRTSSSWSWTEAMHPSSGSGGGKLTWMLFAERLQLRLAAPRSAARSARSAPRSPRAGAAVRARRAPAPRAPRQPAPRSPARLRPRCPAGACSAPRAGPAGARGATASWRSISSLEGGPELLHVAEAVQPLGTRLELAGRLRAAQHEHVEHARSRHRRGRGRRRACGGTSSSAGWTSWRAWPTCAGRGGRSRRGSCSRRSPPPGRGWWTGCTRAEARSA